MNITANRIELLECLESAARAISPRPSHPILNSFYMSATKEKLTVKGFDLSFAIEQTIPLLSGFDVVFTMPAKLLIEILSELDEDKITINVDIPDEDIAPCHTLKTSNSQFRLHSFSPSDYPKLPDPQDYQKVDRITFPSNVFLDACERISSFVSTDETKRVLTGINLESSNGILGIAATDGRRLGYTKLNSDFELSSRTFPVKVLSEIARMCRKAKAEKVTLALADLDGQSDSLFIEFENGKIYGRIFNEAYPNYKQLIPKEYKHSIELDRRSFFSALKLVSVIAEQEKKGGMIDLHWEKDKLEITARAIDCGTARQIINISKINEPMIIRLCAKYLIAGVKFFTSEKIILQANDPNSAIALKGLGQENESLYITMPAVIKD